MRTMSKAVRVAAAVAAAAVTFSLVMAMGGLADHYVRTPNDGIPAARVRDLARRQAHVVSAADRVESARCRPDRARAG